jgi:hypothetical protein
VATVRAPEEANVRKLARDPRNEVLKRRDLGVAMLALAAATLGANSRLALKTAAAETRLAIADAMVPKN